MAGAAGAAAGAVGGIHTAKRLGLEAAKAHDALKAANVDANVAGRAIKAGGVTGAGIAAGAVLAGVAAKHAKNARVKKAIEAKEKAKQQNV